MEGNLENNEKAAKPANDSGIIEYFCRPLDELELSVLANDEADDISCQAQQKKE